MPFKNKYKKCFLDLNDKIFEILSRIIPKSKYNLPLNFEGKRFYTSKIITLTSIMVFSIIIWNIVDNINKIGTITNVFYLEDSFKENIMLSKNNKY